MSHLRARGLEDFRKTKKRDDKMKCADCEKKLALTVCNDRKARCKQCMDKWLKDKLIKQGLFK
jgi:hypothetical protein